MNKKIAVLAIMGTLTLPLDGEAAIAVVDSQNIAQQAKTYAEAVKVATNQAQQIMLQIRELESLPQDVLNEYIGDLTGTAYEITNTVNSVGNLYRSTVSKENVKNYLDKKFLKLKQGEITEKKYREETAASRETLATDTTSYLNAYRRLMVQLEKKNKDLEELLRKNQSIEGNKQGQQLANQIAGVQAQIQSIEIAMLNLQHQRKLELEQAQLRQTQNMITLCSAEGESTAKTISAYKKQETNILATKNNPFKRNNKVTW